ncbi:MAG: hypothetical protein IJU78_06545 [Clostridia bacterium]|nr:hypothetical protein [Clostridia bacterium]
MILISTTDERSANIIGDENSNATIAPAAKNTEFAQDGYDRAKISRIFADFLSDEQFGDDDDKHKAFDRFLNEYAEIEGKPIIYDIRKDIPLAAEKWEKIPFIKEIDKYSANDELNDSIDVEYYQKNVTQRFSSVQPPDPRAVNAKWIDDYLETYFIFSKNVIFSPQNYSLNDSVFRTSPFLREFVAYGKNSDEKGVYYGYADPFVLDALQRAFFGARILKRQLLADKSTDEDALTELRRALFLAYLRRAFRRFVSIDSETYRIQLNRHKSRFEAISYNRLSSIDELHPIRLFEKTAAFIRNNLPKEKQDSFTVNVCMIGHAEASKDDNEKALYDLSLLVLRWYNRLKINNKPKLKLNIKNVRSIRSDDEKPYSKDVSETDEWKLPGVKCTVEYSDYLSDFAFSTRRLKELIDENHLTVILDCPWLTTENFDIKKSGSLNSYCHLLQSTSRLEPSIEDNDKFNSDSQYFYQFSSMHRLDAQLNRIMSSQTLDAGEIVRVLKDPLLDKIKRIVKSAAQERNEQKSVYVFTSEGDGIDYSSIGFYPLTRSEQYDGKSFTIIGYEGMPDKIAGSADRRILKAGSGNDDYGYDFRIHLWAFVKYLAISYAYDQLKDKTAGCLGLTGNNKKHIPDYIGIYRSIYLCAKIGKELKSISFEVRLGDALDDCLTEAGVSDDRKKNVKKALLKMANELFKPLCEKVLFSNNTRYGNDAMRHVFLMNLRSALSYKKAMLFWHKYRMALRQDDCASIKCEFREYPDASSELLETRDKDFQGHDFFMDKKLYEYALAELEYSDQLSLPTRTLFGKSEEMYSASYNGKSALSAVLENIKKECEAVSLKDTRLYENVVSALETIYYNGEWI